MQGHASFRWCPPSWSPLEGLCVCSGAHLDLDLQPGHTHVELCTRLPQLRFPAHFRPSAWYVPCARRRVDMRVFPFFGPRALSPRSFHRHTGLAEGFPPDGQGGTLGRGFTVTPPG